MAVDDWKDMMPHTVTVASLSSTDDYGAPTFGTAVSYSARVVSKPTHVKAADGAEVLARGYLWINGLPTITPTDKITLPDSSTPPILAIDKVPDEDGDHHVKVYFG